MAQSPLRMCLILSVIFLAATSLQADEAVTLRYKLDEDDKLIYRTVTGFKQSQSVNNMEITTEMTQTDVSVRTLQKVDEKGNFRIQTENKRLQMKMGVGPIGTYEFDSESTERDTSSVLGAQIGPVYDRLNGAILTMTFSPRGEIVEVKGYQELIGDLLKDNPIAAQFAGGGSDDAAKLGMADQFVFLPAGPVKPGDTWEQSYKLNLPQIGEVEGKRIYKYVGPDTVGETPTAKIGVTYQMAFDLNIDTGQAQVSGRMSIGNSSGTIQFDPQQGRVLKRESSYTLSGNLTVSAGGNTLPVQTTQTHETKVELLDELPE